MVTLFVGHRQSEYESDVDKEIDFLGDVGIVETAGNWADNAFIDVTEFDTPRGIFFKKFFRLVGHFEDTSAEDDKLVLADSAPNVKAGSQQGIVGNLKIGDTVEDPLSGENVVVGKTSEEIALGIKFIVRMLYETEVGLRQEDDISVHAESL